VHILFHRILCHRTMGRARAVDVIVSALGATVASGVCLDLPAAGSPCLLANTADDPQYRCSVAAEKCVWVQSKCLDLPATDSACFTANGFQNPEYICGTAAEKCVWVQSKCLDLPATGSACLTANAAQNSEYICGAAAEKCVWWDAATCDAADYRDQHNNACSHYTNNPSNCKHSDAYTKNTDGKRPCEACCKCANGDGCETTTTTTSTKDAGDPNQGLANALQKLANDSTNESNNESSASDGASSRLPKAAGCLFGAAIMMAAGLS